MTASAAFRSNFTKRSLTSIYWESVRYKGTVGLDGVNTSRFENDIDSEIRIIHRKVREGTYAFTPYRAKLISKGPKKAPRILSIPTLRDKLVLRATMQVLSSVFSAHLYRKSLHKIIDEVCAETLSPRYDFFLRFDVKDYYPSIRHDLLLRQLSGRIRKPEILSLLRSAISNPTKYDGKEVPPDRDQGGIPQGLPISNILADIYLDPLDRQFVSRGDIAFFRYVDDILILCNRGSGESVVEDLKIALEQTGLSVHEFSDGSGKSTQGVLAERFQFLGYTFSPTAISVRTESQKALRESLVGILTWYKYKKSKRLRLLEWRVNLQITGCVFNQTRYGWLHFFSQITDEGTLHSLDHFLQRQLRRFGMNRDKIRVKSFVRAWHEINFNSARTSYVPNFDSYSAADKRRCVAAVRSLDTSQLSDADVDHEFKKIIYRSIRRLEKDLERTS